MHDAIFNEFDAEAAFGATSEWVVTSPTKAFYTDRNSGALQPFSNVFQDDGSACETIVPTVWDQEELPTLAPQGSIDFNPPPPGPPGSVLPMLCNSVAVLGFNQPTTAGVAMSQVFGSPNVSQYSLKSNNISLDRGWLRIDLARLPPSGTRTLTSMDGDVFSGLPVIGFSAINETYRTTAGRLVRSGDTHAHRVSASILGN